MSRAWSRKIIGPCRLGFGGVERSSSEGIVATLLALSGGSPCHSLVVETIRIALAVLFVEDCMGDIGLGLCTLVHDGMVRHSFKASRGHCGCLLGWDETVVLTNDLQSRDDVLLNGPVIGVG